MKSILGWLVLALFALSGCKPDPIEVFVVSPAAVENVAYQGDRVSIDVVSTVQNWTIVSDQTWCALQQATGSGNATVVLEISANLERTARTATVTLSSPEANKRITITQLPSDGTEHHYKLPIVFHVLYVDPTNSNQNVRRGYLAEIVGEVNTLFRGTVGMDLEFVMAPTDPQGRPLEEAGVERIRYASAFPINIDQLMNTKNNAFKKLLWDPNQYINVFVCPFYEQTTLGIAHLPLTPRDHFLAGTSESLVSNLTLDNITYTCCVSFNSDYIYDRSDAQNLNPSDFVVTAAHELGHYLGLHHAFTEDQKTGETVDDCFDSDYCPDTPTYNRVAYEQWLRNYLATSSRPTVSEAIKRTPCSGAPFNSTNVMDYAVSLANAFTADQRARVRHVLTYSPLIPGPKLDQSKTQYAKGIMPEIPFRSIE